VANLPLLGTGPQQPRRNVTTTIEILPAAELELYIQQAVDEARASGIADEEEALQKAGFDLMTRCHLIPEVQLAYYVDSLLSLYHRPLTRQENLNPSLVLKFNGKIFRLCSIIFCPQLETHIYGFLVCISGGRVCPERILRRYLMKWMERSSKSDYKRTC
jgi:hypothetical protein